MAYEWLRYTNQGATRNRPISPRLAESLSFLPELGVTAEVFSGGQAGKDEGGPRTGSTRHDHGNAADIRFYQDGRQLDWANENDRPIFEEIVRRGKDNGVTGFGAGPGYMAPGTMHVGFGAPGVWGAGGRSANAPDWLRQAYGAPAAPSEGTGTEMAYGTRRGDVLYGGAVDDTLGVEPVAPPSNPGGLGGLGGFVQSDGFGDFLGALGTSLLSSPSNAPLSGVGGALESAQTRRLRQQAIEQDRADKVSQQRALELALRSQGFTAEQARAYAVSPSAANVAVQGQEYQRKLGLAEAARQRDSSFLSGLGATAEAAPVAAAPVDDTIGVTGSDGATTAAGGASSVGTVPGSYATGNSTVDAYMARRAKIVAQLANAPSDDAFQRGKILLDQTDKEIERYAPTGAMKEYAFSMQQRQDAGQPPIPFDQWDQQGKKASAQSISVNTGEGDKFYENLDRKNAERFATLSDGGQDARSRLGQLGQLETLLKESPSGLEARVKLIAGDYGVNTEGLDGLQATRALIEKMVPAQREPGSGPLSDRDVEGFRRSLPSVINQPGGNALILGTAKAIADYDIQRGDIADMVADRTITPAEGRKRLRELQNPLAGYSELISTLGKNGQRGGELVPGMDPRNDPVTAGASTPAPVKLTNPSDYNSLPSGTVFIAPDGSKRKKP